MTVFKGWEAILKNRREHMFFFRTFRFALVAIINMVAGIIHLTMPIFWSDGADWLTNAGGHIAPWIITVADSSATEMAMGWFGIANWHGSVVAMLRSNPLDDKVADTIIFVALIIIVFMTIKLVTKSTQWCWCRLKPKKRQEAT